MELNIILSDRPDLEKKCSFSSIWSLASDLQMSVYNLEKQQKTRK